MLTSEIAEKLNSVYLDVSNPGAFGGIRALHDEVKKRKWKISQKTIIEYLNSKPVYSIYQIRRKKFPRAPVVAWGIDYVWSVDLAEFQKLKTTNYGIRYVLVSHEIHAAKAICIYV